MRGGREEGKKKEERERGRGEREREREREREGARQREKEEQKWRSISTPSGVSPVLSVPGERHGGGTRL